MQSEDAAAYTRQVLRMAVMGKMSRRHRRARRRRMLAASIGRMR